MNDEQVVGKIKGELERIQRDNDELAKANKREELSKQILILLAQSGIDYWEQESILEGLVQDMKGDY